MMRARDDVYEIANNHVMIFRRFLSWIYQNDWFPLNRNRRLIIVIKNPYRTIRDDVARVTTPLYPNDCYDKNLARLSSAKISFRSSNFYLRKFLVFVIFIFLSRYFPCNQNIFYAPFSLDKTTRSRL